MGKFTKSIVITICLLITGSAWAYDYQMDSLMGKPVWESLQRDSIFPQSQPPAETVYIFDVATLSNEERCLLTTAQGIINKKHPSLFLYSSVADTTFSADKRWIDWLDKNDYIKKTKEIRSIEEVLEKWSIKEVILVDSDLPASINVATMMAGFENIPIAYSETVEKYDLTVKVSLENKWQSNIDAYQWAFDQYWDKMDHSTVAWYSSTSQYSHLRDYLVTHNIFTFWVTGQDDGNPDNSNTEEEKQFIRKLLVEKIPVGIPVIGFPWGSNTEGINEIEGVLIMGRAGKYHVCNNWRPNLSIWSGLKSKKQTYKQLPPRDIKLEKGKVYATLLMSDGDNMNTWFNYFPEYWDSPHRGKFPIAWTMGPAIIDMQGPLLDFYFDSIKQTDSIGCSVSGAGYIHPTYFARDFAPEYREKIWNDYLHTTEKYMRKLDMNWMHIFRNAPVEDTPLHRFAAMTSVQTILSDYWGRLEYPGSHYMIDETVVVHAIKGTNMDLVNEPIKKILEQTPEDRPAFMHIFLVNWIWSYDKINEMVEDLPEDFVLVRPDELNSLYKQWKQAK